MGITFAFRLGETGATAARSGIRWAIANEVFRAHFWNEIEALDNRIGADVQLQLQTEFRKLIERATRWILAQHACLGRSWQKRTKFSDGIKKLLPILPASCTVAICNR